METKVARSPNSETPSPKPNNIIKLISNKKKLAQMQKESKKIISKWDIDYSKKCFKNIINRF